MLVPFVAPTLALDAYQLTTLVAHADADRLAQQVSMAFFFRRMPAQRGYVVFAGLRHLLAHAAAMRLSPLEAQALDAHPVLGPALAARPTLRRALYDLAGFEGEIQAMPEGTLAFAGPSVRTSGEPAMVGGAQLSVYTPMLQVKTDLLRAKLIETPWLGYINHLSMVASKAARVVVAAQGKPVLEFGQRRTHPLAAMDATYAAYLVGVSASSNVAAFAHYGVPASGTMDHFAVQASERAGQKRGQTEQAFFETYAKAFDGAVTFLVDTYDTPRGIESAARAARGRPFSIRIDSNVNVESLKRARDQLGALGAPDAKIFVSDGLDEKRVQELAPYADGFGIGENIVCSPDAATGVGAVAKLVVNGYGQITMKLAKGSGKATLPGRLQVYRFRDHDLLTLEAEAAPAGGRALLETVWRGNAALAQPSIEQARAHVQTQLETLPQELKSLGAPPARTLVLSDALFDLVTKLSKEAGA
jgi:nicotinate phosphoribosyltransferase